jgi:hypothetical protein
LSASLQGTDFVDFYAAASRVAEGHAYNSTMPTFSVNIRLGTRVEWVPFTFIPHSVQWQPYFAVALLKTLAEGKRASIVTRSDSASRLDFDAAFGGTAMFAPPVSYHLNLHDLSLVLLPIFLLMRSVWLRPQRPRSLTNWVTLSLLVIVFLPLLHLWALEAHSYDWIIVPLLLLFLMNGQAARPNQADAATLK